MILNLLPIMKTLPTTILSGLFSLVAFSSMASETLDLSGEWKLALDPTDAGLAAGPETWNFPDTIQLPGTLTLAGKGNPLTRQPTLDKQTLQELHQRHSYIGPAWYQREVEIPAGWADKDIILELERVIWQSRLWINGSEAGVYPSAPPCSAHSARSHRHSCRP